jgi:hypothetical protein
LLLLPPRASAARTSASRLKALAEARSHWQLRWQQQLALCNSQA